MAKTEYGILLREDQFRGVRLLLEQLRYSGAVSKREGGKMFILTPLPAGVDQLMWQNGNVSRQASFGIKATRISRAKGSVTWSYEDGFEVRLD